MVWVFCSYSLSAFKYFETYNIYNADNLFEIQIIYKCGDYGSFYQCFRIDI